MQFKIRARQAEDSEWIRVILRERWGSTKIVSRGRLHDAGLLPGFIAIAQQNPIGLLIYRIEEDSCEVVTLDSEIKGIGVGSALLRAVEAEARRCACNRIWLVTTNDNVQARTFYLKRGFNLRAVHAGAIQAARLLKPEIPTHSSSGVPIEDEWEFERLL